MGNLGLDEFFAWYGQEPRPGFTKATVAAALEARGLGSVSINVRITAVRKLALEAADNGLLAPQVADMITMFTILPAWRNCSLGIVVRVPPALENQPNAFQRAMG